MQYTSQKARISRCCRYRYSLERSWGSGQGTVVFIGLNPSTADHKQDDPTIRRCVGFARAWGFESMAIVNLFAYRATLPQDLKTASDPVGPRNNYWLKKLIDSADLAIACWGNHGSFRARNETVLKRFSGLYCIVQNNSLHPAHPLYLKANLTPIPLQQSNRHSS
ncbi:MAG: hypothetical protein ACI95C_002325 [Pseudohongiellaceae bacterium]